MIKRFCDRCAKEIKPDKDIMKPFRWWTITMHSETDITLELCDECGKANNTTETEYTIAKDSETVDFKNGKNQF